MRSLILTTILLVSSGCGIDIPLHKYKLSDIVKVTGVDCPVLIQAKLQPIYYGGIVLCPKGIYPLYPTGYKSFKDYEIEGYFSKDYTSIDWNQIMDLVNQAIEQYGDQLQGYNPEDLLNQTQGLTIPSLAVNLDKEGK